MAIVLCRRLWSGIHFEIFLSQIHTRYESYIGTVMAAHLDSSFSLAHCPMKDENEEKPLQLLSLPVELLSKILEFASGKDILQARLTCKLIYDVTTRRQFWLNFYNNFKDSMNPLPSLPHPLDRDFSSYTSTGLERLLMRSTNTNMSLPTYGIEYRPTNKNIHTYGSNRYTNIRMIPGGRWVLAADPLSGQVFYCDAQSNATGSKMLISNFTKRGPCLAIIKSAVDIDVETGNHLSFTYAIHVDIRISNPKPGQSRPVSIKFIDVWRITLIKNPGCKDALSAEHLSHIPMRFSDEIQPVSSFSIRGPFLAYPLTVYRIDNGIPSFVSVFNWTNCSADGESKDLSEYKQKFAHKREGKRIKFTQIHLISEDKILVGGCETDPGSNNTTFLRLYDLSSVPEQMGPAPFPSDIIPRMFQFQLGGMDILPNNFSPPYFCIGDGTVKFTMQSSDSVYGIIIPLSTSKDKHPKLVTLFRNPRLAHYDLRVSGYETAITYSNSDHEFAILRYTWNGDTDIDNSSSEYQIMEFTPKSNVLYEVSFFDDASWRFLALGPREIYVFSFSS